MPPPFPVIEIDASADRVEHLGTKEKFWVRHDDSLCLVKFPRPGTGEHWAEKLASHIADELGFRHAQYELALIEKRQATISPSFLPSQAVLVHGNEILGQVLDGYDESAPRYRQSGHTLDIVLGILSAKNVSWGADSGFSPAELFVGYLMLDALIGNTDRHHENWGLVGQRRESGVTISLAPSFDHASSLGCHGNEDYLLKRLEGADPRVTIETYCRRAPSALYRNDTDTKPLSTLEAFRLAALRYPPSARRWLDRLERITPQFVANLIERVPQAFMPEVNRRFASAMIRCNRERLEALEIR